jgi:hypothetical protein
VSDKVGKHTPFFELVDAQAKPGCPICRMIYTQADRYLDSILYEAVLDPDVRAKLKRSRGFCADHAEMLRRKPGRALGIALIYRDIIRFLAETGDKGHYEPENSIRVRLLKREQGGLATASRMAAEQECPACQIAKDSEGLYVGLLASHLQDDDLYSAYAEGEGLCVSHLLRALEQVADEASFERLVKPQAARYRVMLRDLDEFIRKRDHRFREEKYGEEGDVWLRALNAIVGGAGMGLSARWGGRRSQDLDDRLR